MTTEDRRDSWRDYLLTRQGPTGVAFRGSDSAGDFTWSTIAQSVGPAKQLVNFVSGPVHYRRTDRQVRGGDDNFRLMVPVEGEFKVRQRDSAEIVEPGTIAFLRWGERVVLDHDTPMRALIMTVPREAVGHAGAENAPLVLDPRRPLVQSLLSEITQLHAHHGHWATADFTIAYDNALRSLNGVLNPPPGPADRRALLAVRAREIMEHHADDPRLTVDAVVKMCEVSRRTLYSALTETFGQAPADLLRAIRLERAFDRLSQPEPADMKAIARAAGYSRPSGLLEALRREYVGPPPKQMRRSRSRGR
ncbi:AraC family transcriptional regulator [Nocardia vaccinii]|uniref:AraC family transcriptional regulator n=1 Tax=Nocardia vaccinii TaxID=1822 RepID=UPI00082AC8AF|nr:AraC family transcriptional regulator [Nocardia vaccinii]